MKNLAIGMGLVAGLAAGVANAQIAPFNTTIVDNDARFFLGSNTSGPNGIGADTSFSVNGAAGPSHLSQAWWWVRVENVDTREYNVYQPTATVTTPAANQVRIVYNYAGQFDLIIQFTVSGFEYGYGSLTQTASIRNRSGSRMTFNLFNYNNVDVLGTAGNDVAAQTGPQTVDFRDGISPFVTATYEATNAIRVDSSTSIRDLLTNGVVDNLFGGIINGGPGDLEVGSQFQFDLNNNGVQSVSTTLTIIPAPGAAALLGIGGLIAGRRRRA